MPNKIQEELKKIAQEIIATEGSVDFEKTYHQTLSLFEKLVVLKNTQVVEKDTWKDMESNYNKAIDFIELKKEPVKVLGQNREEILPLMETIKEIVAEFPKVDLMFCRDCLFHLSFSDIRKVLINFVNSDIEKCSESIGTISVLYFAASFFIKCQPHTMDSLFAKRIFLLNFTKVKVGFSPASPGIAETVISIFFKY